MKHLQHQTQLFQQNIILGFLVIGLFLVLPALTFATPGDLDLSFGNGGKVITQIGNSNAYANATLVQPDGKIVAVGYNSVLGVYKFILTRYNADGSLDNSFGTGGIVVTSISVPSGGDSVFDLAYAAAIQADGKIIAAGFYYSRISFAGFALVRYNTDGSLDSSFGTGGKVMTPINGIAYAVAIQSDGKIVVAGDTCYGWDDCNYNFALVRYNTNGSLDTSFGQGGIVITQFGSNGWNAYDEAYAVAIQSDGKIIAAGHGGDSTNFGFGLTRYNSDGSLDASFGTGGKVIIKIGSNSYDSARAVAIQSDGKIVAVGKNENDYASKIALVRLNTNGLLDTAFGSGGIVVASVNSTAYAVAIQRNGKIVVAGYEGTIGPTAADIDLMSARYNSDGSLDTSFGSGGRVVTPIGSGNSSASAVAIQPDGRIVAAGYSYNGTNTDFALVRYLGDSITTRRTQFDFDGDGRSDISVFRPSNGAWYLNQSTNGFSATQFGLSTDKITPADYDGDGKTDVAVFRDGFWYLQRSLLGFTAIQFGQAGDVPVPADYDGDGKADVAVFRSGFWYILQSSNNQFRAVQFGVASDKTVPADYDGDGKADMAVVRQGSGASNWYILGTNRGFYGLQFGTDTDKLVPADYDGDGKTDQAVYRDGTWYLLRSSQGFTAFQFGIASDIPAPADYDGDGKIDIAVYRGGTWYVLQSSNGQFATQQFGAPDDIPVAAANAQ